MGTHLVTDDLAVAEWFTFKRASFPQNERNKEMNSTQAVNRMQIFLLFFGRRGQTTMLFSL